MLREDLLVRKPSGVDRMSLRDLMRLPEYSSSLPTGVEHGKKWRRDINFWERRNFAHLHFWNGTPQPGDFGELWWTGEYRAIPGNSEEFDIIWRRVELVESKRAETHS